MPRTKRPVRKHEKQLEDDDTLKKLDSLVNQQKSKIDELVQLQIKTFKMSFKILVAAMRSEDFNKTIGQLKSELNLKEPICSVVEPPSRPASHDDGYLTENSAQGSGERTKKKYGIPVSTSRSTAGGRRSRSADPGRRAAPSACKPAARRRSRSVYRTPAMVKNAANVYPCITPKVAPQTPLTMLRQPRAGEMVVSMSGSPVMVPTFNNMQRDEMANCNIMLQDGTMLSLQPKQLRQSQVYIPFSLMDQTVLKQLKTLKDNLDKVVRLGEKNISK